MRNNFGQHRAETGSEGQERNRECAKEQVGLLEDPQHAQVPRADGPAARTVSQCLNIPKFYA